MLGLDLRPRSEPLAFPWPSSMGPAGFISFDAANQWHRFIMDLSIDAAIPLIVRAKYSRAQKLYLLGWIDLDLVKAGELVALTALELALRDRYGREVLAKQNANRKRKKDSPDFAALLKHMLDSDGLTDAHIPMVVRWGWTAVGRVYGTDKPGLADIRNAMAHGDPFDGLPIGGLLELVRDLINYAYRHYLAEAQERREQLGEKTPSGRLPMGRKGIGKLSIFSIAQVAEVYTTLDGDKTAFRMDRDVTPWFPPARIRARQLCCA